jgi:hypothetical protein
VKNFIANPSEIGMHDTTCSRYRHRMHVQERRSPSSKWPMPWRTTAIFCSGAGTRHSTRGASRFAGFKGRPTRRHLVRLM